MKLRRVAIAGAALSDCGRVDDRTDFALHAQAATRAIADAGLPKSMIDGFASTGLGIFPPVEIIDYLGLRPTWFDSTQVGGSSWEVMVAHAADAIALGRANAVILAYGSTIRADLKRGMITSEWDYGSRGPVAYEFPYGHSLISKYAMAARRHMHDFGTTIEQLAEVAVSARFNASLNPEAYYRDPLTIADVIGSPMVADPFSKLHCCIRSDGGGAVVLVAEDLVDAGNKEPVWILGAGEALSHFSLTEWPDLVTSPAAVSGPLAFRAAGVEPSDIDNCQIYDAFTSMVVVTLEDLGFCPKGAGGEFVSDGKLRVGGALPTNTDGGGLSACHPGMRGMFLIIEAVRQLRGEAHGRQVEGASLSCVSGTGGWFCSSGTLILGRQQPDSYQITERGR